MPWSTEFNESVDRHVTRAGVVIECVDTRNYTLESFEGPNEVGEYLRTYPHPRLRKISSDLRADFTFALSQYWYRPSNMYNLFQTISVAVLIGSGYILDLDLEEMGRAVEGDYYQDKTGTWYDMNMPVAYEGHLSEWPETRILQSLSLKARFAFVRTMQYFKLRTGLAAYDRVNPR